MLSALHIKVFGSVQGVFFRSETQRMAGQLGLAGWVKNLEDGSVEVWAEGSKPKLEKLLAWCSHGPPAASVQRVEFDWAEPKNLEEFRVIRQSQ